MQITLETKPFASLEAEALVSYVFENGDPIQGRIAEIDHVADGLLRKLATSGELTGKALEMTLVHTPRGLQARLLLVGAGKREKFDTAVLRRIAGAALRHLKSRSVKQFAFVLRENESVEAAAQAFAEGALTANFESDKYKTDKKDAKSVDSIALTGFPEQDRAAAEKGLARGRVIADAQNFARDLINEPSNILTSKVLGEKAAAMAKEAGLSVDVLDDKRIADLKMGALLSVAQGSVEPPRMMVLTYTPPSPKPVAPVIGLIGKAVTFVTADTSIKPSNGIDHIKTLLAGGVTR